MNISKRIVTLLMCVAMLLSMSTSFAFALGNDAAIQDVVTDSNVINTPIIETADEEETVVGNPDVSVGAKPSTNAKITVNDKTIIVDKDASEGVEYTPSFPGVDFGEKTFTFGTNLFNTLGAATTASAIAEGADVLIKSTTEVTLSIKVAANYYGQAYNMLPYVVGVKEDGSDWTKNTEFFNKALVIDNLYIYNMNSKTINVYGFILKKTLNAGWKHTNLTLNLENFAIQKSDSTSPFFNMYHTKYPTEGDTNTLILKNCYPDGDNWPGSARVFNSGFPTNLILDGWFVDQNKCPGIVAGTSYVYQCGTNPADPSKSTAKIEIKNSNFQNLTQPFLDAHEGVNKKNTVAGQVAEVIFKNNTVNNFTGYAVMAFQGRKYTAMNFSNNFVKANGSAKTFTSTYDSSSGTSTQPFDITVENNKLINISSEAFYMANSSSGTLRELGTVSVKNNYNSSTNGGEGKAVVATTNGVTSTNYYVDSAMTVLNTDLEFSVSSEAGTVVLDDAKKLIYSIDKIGIKDITVTASEKATAAFYSDAGCANAITDINAYTSNVAYLKVAAKANPAIALVYRTEIVKGIAEFDDPHDMIDSSKAVMLTNEASGVADGSVVIVNWLGENYYFTAGTNVFGSLSTLEAANLDNPHVLMKWNSVTSATTNDIDGFYPTKPASFFTQNYADKPYIKGTANDGSDWVSNIGTGADQFNYVNEGIVVNNIGPKADAAEGDYNFYGFTVRCCPMDNSVNKTNILFENTYFYLSAWNRWGFIHITAPNEVDDGEKFVVKNAYLKPQANTNSYTDAAYNSGYNVKPLFEQQSSAAPVLPDYVEFDGLFMDLSAEMADKNKTSSVFVQKGTNTTLYIHNSCFKNYSMLDFRKSGDVAEGISSAVKVEDNIFNNSAFGASSGSILSFDFDAFTEMTVKNNKITRNGDKVVFIGSIGGASVIEAAPLKLTVTGNYVNYCTIPSVWIDNRNLTADSVAKDNYVGTAYDTLTSGSPIEFKLNKGYIGAAGGANILKSATWLITADGSNTSSMIQPFTFNGADIADTNTITVEADVTKLNLGAYFANKTTTTADNENKYNAYTDESCSDESLVNIKELPVAAAGAKVYVKAVSPDGLTVSEATYEIIINKKVAYNVGNSAQPSSFSHYYKGNNYYWLGWRGQVEGTGTAASDIANSRVGTLFLSDTANLQTMKDALAAKVAEMTDADDIRTIVDEVNADAQFTTGENANTIKAYTMSVDNTSALTWDSVSQTYGYRYNFSVIEGRYRGTVMFAVYKDSDGVYRITFSDLVVQQSGLN